MAGRTFRVRAITPAARGVEGNRSLLQLKSQGSRVLGILSALAALGLVLQAGHRWF